MYYGILPLTANNVESILKYRYFIYGIVKRNFQSRYLNSIIGAGWAIINPLAMLFVYTLIFSQVLQSRLPSMTSVYGYSIYLFIGLIIWGLFSQIVTHDSKVFIDHANIIKKIKFPWGCLPIIVIASALVDFFIQFILFAGFLIAIDGFPGIVIINILPLIITVILLGSGVGMILGTLNVYYRDIGELAGIVIQFWFWFTPIVYPTTIVPVWAKQFILLNPMTSIIQPCQNVFLTGVGPAWSQIVPTFIVACSLNALAFLIYSRFASEIVDEL